MIQSDRNFSDKCFPFICHIHKHKRTGSVEDMSSSGCTGHPPQLAGSCPLLAASPQSLNVDISKFGTSDKVGLDKRKIYRTTI